MLLRAVARIDVSQFTTAARVDVLEQFLLCHLIQIDLCLMVALRVAHLIVVDTFF